ncbi:MAG: heme-binding domain-containing protein [Myxococcales bacterium]|nr:heme-binding domain-containing protein [Myxococcales bacterium]
MTPTIPAHARSPRGHGAALLACLLASAGGALLLLACAGSDGDAAARDLVPCDVAQVLERYCLRCHSDPPDHFAPFPLTTWERMQEETFAGSGVPLWQAMADSIERGFMPPLAFALDPPVEPLPEADAELLLTWLHAGAPQGDACSR